MLGKFKLSVIESLNFMYFLMVKKHCSEKEAPVHLYPAPKFVY
jgi:hypothetical protein